MLAQAEAQQRLTLPDIRLLRLQIRTRWSQPTTIPGPVVANVLRGALGLTLRKLVCPEGWMDHDCHSCPLYRDCAYGQVFQPSPPEGAQQLRNAQDLPRPFVIEPPGLKTDEPQTPEGLTFRLMLFGTAADSLLYFISTLERLGQEGMGKDRVPFVVEQIVALHPDGDELLFGEGQSQIALPQRYQTTRDIVSREWPVEELPTVANPAVRSRILQRMGQQPLSEEALQPSTTGPRVRLRFLTPLLLKSGSSVQPDGLRVPAREVTERPEMGVIIRRLRDRLSSLSAFFGEGWTGTDFGAWGTVADRVRIVESRTTWLSRKRTSTRTGQSHDLDGLVGETLYEFPDQQTLDQLLPLLKVGECLNVGKNVPWGNGAFQGIIVGRG